MKRNQNRTKRTRALALALLLTATAATTAAMSRPEREAFTALVETEPRLERAKPTGDTIRVETVKMEAASRAPVEPEPVEVWESLGVYNLTAYCPCERCCGYWATIRPLDENGNPIVKTATGTRAEAGRTIAVDPSVIPYGSKVKIGSTIYVAEDCGGAIKGNRIDVYHDDHQEALVFGRQDVEVFVLAAETN